MAAEVVMGGGVTAEAGKAVVVREEMVGRIGSRVRAAVVAEGA